MQVLVLSADPLLVSALTEVSREFAIETHHTDDHQRASDHLHRTKYAGLVLDLDTVRDIRSLIACLHKSPFNKNAVVFAVATNIGQIEKALEGRAQFILRRPLESQAVRKTLRSAYDLLSGKQRRDFRHPATLRVTLRAIPEGPAIEGKTVNVSGNGLAVAMSAPLKVAAPMEITLTLPGGFVVQANGVVIWSDQHGKGGLHFQCITTQERAHFDAWLDVQFALKARTGSSQ